MKMKRLCKNSHAQMNLVVAAVALFMTLLISILIYYNIAGVSVHTHDYAAESNATAALWNQSNNATSSINNQAATFYTVAPIIGIVIVAVVVIGYVKNIG